MLQKSCPAVSYGINLQNPVVIKQIPGHCGQARPEGEGFQIYRIIYSVSDICNIHLQFKEMRNVPVRLHVLKIVFNCNYYRPFCPLLLVPNPITSSVKP